MACTQNLDRLVFSGSMTMPKKQIINPMKPKTREPHPMLVLWFVVAGFIICIGSTFKWRVS